MSSPTIEAREAPKEGDAGYAAIDALVGVSILAVSLSLSIGAVVTANRLAREAERLQGARAALSAVLDRPDAGQREPGQHLCRVEARDSHVSGKRPLAMATLRPCAGPPS